MTVAPRQQSRGGTLPRYARSINIKLCHKLKKYMNTASGSTPVTFGPIRFKQCDATTAVPLVAADANQSKMLHLSPVLCMAREYAREGGL